METRKQAIMAALDKFVAQRPGLEFGNYGDVKAYRSEMRSITRDRHDYNVLARAVERSDSITADMLIKASESAFSGRLTIKSCPHGDSARTTCGKHVWCGDCEPGPSALCPVCNGATRSPVRPNGTRIDYVTGQYFPTEYRKAATAILASALWDHYRENCMPVSDDDIRFKDNDKAQMQYWFKTDSVRGRWLSAGDWLRAHFRREFGRGIANRWFS